jgi:ribonuclease Z
MAACSWTAVGGIVTLPSSSTPAHQSASHCELHHASLRAQPAGEGSYGQLKRRFGSAAADDLLCALRCIWISHIHADHHVGLPALLAARTRLLGPKCPPLLVLGPRPLRRALQGYAQLEPMRFRFVEASATAGVPLAGASNPPAVSPEVRAAIDAVVASLGLSRFESVMVAHCAHAYGLVLEGGVASSNEAAGGGTGWKLVFSGDTRPCPQLVEAAKGATLLIHEVGGCDLCVLTTCAFKWCSLQCN